MSDPISRQAVLRLFATHDGKYLYEAIQALPSAQPEQCEDAVSRKAAIDALNDEFTIIGKTNAIVVQDYIRRVNNRLHNLPSAQPERKRGKWIMHIKVKNVYGGKYIECSECHEKYSVMHIEDELFCRCCGSFNAEEGEQE